MHAARSLMWTFFPPLLTILVLSLVLVTGFAGQAVRTFVLRETGKDLEHMARITAPLFAAALGADDEAGGAGPLPAVPDDLTGMRFTVIMAGGRVVGDSLRSPARMDNHADRPEVLAALAGRDRPQPPLQRDPGPPAGLLRRGRRNRRGQPFVVRASISEATLAEVMSGALARIALAGLVLALLAGLIAVPAGQAPARRPGPPAGRRRSLRRRRPGPAGPRGRHGGDRRPGRGHEPHGRPAGPAHRNHRHPAPRTGGGDVEHGRGRDRRRSRGDHHQHERGGRPAAGPDAGPGRGPQHPGGGPRSPT